MSAEMLLLGQELLRKQEFPDAKEMAKEIIKKFKPIAVEKEAQVLNER